LFFEARVSVDTQREEFEDIEFEAAEDYPPRIEPGKHMGKCTEVKIIYIGGRPKIRLTFLVAVDDENYDTDYVAMYCYMPKPPKRVHPAHSFYKNFVVANEGIKPKRADRMSMRIFKDKFFWVEVVDVTVDFKKEKKSEEDVYSKVKKLLKLVSEDFAEMVF